MVNFGYLSTYLRTGWRVTTATHTLFSPYVKINFFLIQVECDGILIGFSFKLLILLFGTWALFHRGSRGARATMPRIHLFRAALSLLLFIFVFAFWLFYGVRVFNEQKRRLVIWKWSAMQTQWSTHYYSSTTWHWYFWKSSIFPLSKFSTIFVCERHLLFRKTFSVFFN